MESWCNFRTRVAASERLFNVHNVTGYYAVVRVFKKKRFTRGVYIFILNVGRKFNVLSPMFSSTMSNRRASCLMCTIQFVENTYILFEMRKLSKLFTRCTRTRPILGRRRRCRFVACIIYRRHACKHLNNNVSNLSLLFVHNIPYLVYLAHQQSNTVKNSNIHRKM